MDTGLTPGRCAASLIRQQAIAKSRCSSKGFNLRLRAEFSCAILLFADLERARGEVIVVGGEVIMAGGEVIVVGGEAVMAGGEAIMAGGEGMIAGPTSGPLHSIIHCAQRYFQHASKRSQQLSSLSRSKHSQQLCSLLRSKPASKDFYLFLMGESAIDAMCMGTEGANLVVCQLRL